MSLLKTRYEQTLVQLRALEARGATGGFEHADAGEKIIQMQKDLNVSYVHGAPLRAVAYRKRGPFKLRYIFKDTRRDAFTAEQKEEFMKLHDRYELNQLNEQHRLVTFSLAAMKANLERRNEL